MPCIKIIDSIKIYVYSRDHQPPHFHAIINDFEELIIIGDLTTYSGKIPSKSRKKLMNWATRHQDILMKNREMLNK